MWTGAFWTAVLVMVGPWAVGLAAVVVVFWAVQQVADGQSGRFRRKAARQGRTTVAEIQRRMSVDDIQAQIARANRDVHRRLAMETVIRNDREFDAEVATAATVGFAAVADEPAPEEAAVCVPRPRSSRRRPPRDLLKCREAAGRGGSR